MSYHGAYYDRRKQQIHVWDDEDGHVIHDHEPYAYAPDPKGEWKGIDGLRYKKITEWSQEAEKLGIIHEHDVPPATRCLVDNYFEHDEPSKKNQVLFFDIEVLKHDGRYSEPEDAEGIINSIAYYSEKSGWNCIVLDFDLKVEHLQKRKTVEIPKVGELDCQLTIVNSEDVLLKMFLEAWADINPSIVSGWNINYFDIPYLYRRVEKKLGTKWAKTLSKINIVQERYGISRLSYEIGGVAVYDYLELYKNFPNKELSNYRLDTVAMEVLGRGKIEYEGDLDMLYKRDLEKFIMYNIVDVELVKSIDGVMDHIQTAIGIAHKGHVDYEAIFKSSWYLDGASLTYCKRNGLVAIGNTQQWNRKAKGAFVKKPNPGIYPWVYDLDLTSLYPMNIITLNISPETKMALVENWNEEEYVKAKSDKEYIIRSFRGASVSNTVDDIFSSESQDGKVFKGECENIGINELGQDKLKIRGHANMKQFLELNNFSIASNGCMYDLSKPGLIPSILKGWFNERKEFKKLRDQHEDAGNSVESEYYDRQQLITKIMLNSFYGVLLLNSFRFYDLDNGEAVTLTGQSVIGWASKMTDNIYSKEFGKDEYVIYTDTDSIFCPLLPYLKHKFGDNFEEERTEKEIVDYSLEVIDNIQDKINESYKLYGKALHNVDQTFWDLKQELIAKRAVWIGKFDKKTYEIEGVKKRYAMWLVWEEGFPVKKIDIKGMDSVRSDFPKMFREFQKKVLIDILHDKQVGEMNEIVSDFKDSLEEADIFDIMNSTGLNNMEEYKPLGFNQFKKRTPVHLKASFAYNQLLDHKELIGHTKINDSIKIVWAYLKKNQYNFQTFALKGFDDPEEFIEFVEKYIDRDKLFKKTLLKKLNSVWRSCGWGEVVFNSNFNKFFSV